MYPANFDYKRPATVDEAVALLAQHGDAAKLLAGGHSLIPAMKLRLAQPKVVVDIGRISTLSYIREAGGKLAIGAMTTHQEIAASRLLQDKCPLLPETASHIGDVQVRNKGTIGGSLAHADPAADYPATILALDAEIEVAGPNGRRTIRAGDFFVDLLQTAIAANELITEIRVPVTEGERFRAGGRRGGHLAVRRSRRRHRHRGESVSRDRRRAGAQGTDDGERDRARGDARRRWRRTAQRHSRVGRVPRAPRAGQHAPCPRARRLPRMTWCQTPA